MDETTSTLPPPAPAAPPPPLRRSLSDRKVAGVCGGLARHLGIDPVILRILIAVLALFGGSGLLLYAAGWLLIPNEGSDASELQQQVQRHGRTTVIVVGVVVAIISLSFDGSWFGWTGHGLVPLVIVGGLVLLVYNSRPSQPPIVPGTVPPAAQTPQPEAYVWAPAAASAEATTATSDGLSPAGPVRVAAPSKPTKPPKERSALGLLTVSIAAIAAGVMVLLDRAGAVEVHPVPFLAILLGIVALGLVLGSFFGRARWLIVLGVLLALTLAAGASLPGVSSRSAGPVTWTPTTLTAVPADGYQWAAGDARLDLTALPVTGTVHVASGLGAGTLTVTVPDDVTLQLTTHVGVGSIEVPDPDGAKASGFGLRKNVTLLPAGTSTGTLVLDLAVGAGTLEVQRA